MNSTTEARAEGNWPPQAGESVSFKSGDGWKTGILQEVRWGLVWRDFMLEDGRVIPEIKVAGCPQPPVWRAVSEVTPAERDAAEERLASMAEAGLDPREREQWFLGGTQPVLGVYLSQIQAFCARAFGCRAAAR